MIICLDNSRRARLLHRMLMSYISIDPQQNKQRKIIKLYMNNMSFEIHIMQISRCTLGQYASMKLHNHII